MGAEEWAVGLWVRAALAWRKVIGVMEGTAEEKAIGNLGRILER